MEAVLLLASAAYATLGIVTLLAGKGIVIGVSAVITGAIFALLTMGRLLRSSRYKSSNDQVISFVAERLAERAFRSGTSSRSDHDHL